MIEVIVNVRDAVFAALVAWTGVGDAEPREQLAEPFRPGGEVEHGRDHRRRAR